MIDTTDTLLSHVNTLGLVVFREINIRKRAREREHRHRERDEREERAKKRREG